jgi:hypothetical protein
MIFFQALPLYGEVGFSLLANKKKALLLLMLLSLSLDLLAMGISLSLGGGGVLCSPPARFLSIYLSIHPSNN